MVWGSSVVSRGPFTWHFQCTLNAHWICFVRVHMQVHWMHLTSMCMECTLVHSTSGGGLEVDLKRIAIEMHGQGCGSHVIQFLPIPHPTPRGAAEESRRTAKYWQDVWRVDSHGNKSAKRFPFPSSSSTRAYHVAKNCHAFNSHRITSPQSLIWICTMCIEFASPRMWIQREFNAHWRKVSCEWALAVRVFPSCVVQSSKVVDVKYVFKRRAELVYKSSIWLTRHVCMATMG